jgi:hypothetical protein
VGRGGAKYGEAAVAEFRVTTRRPRRALAGREQAAALEAKLAAAEQAAAAATALGEELKQRAAAEAERAAAAHQKLAAVEAEAARNGLALAAARAGSNDAVHAQMQAQLAAALAAQRRTPRRPPPRPRALTSPSGGWPQRPSGRAGRRRSWPLQRRRRRGLLPRLTTWWLRARSRPLRRRACAPHSKCWALPQTASS